MPRLASLRGPATPRSTSFRGLEDPDYEPKKSPGSARRRPARPPGLMRIDSAPFATTSSMVGDDEEPSTPTPKKGWRKPRTARLQFWNHQVRLTPSQKGILPSRLGLSPQIDFLAKQMNAQGLTVPSRVSISSCKSFMIMRGRWVVFFVGGKDFAEKRIAANDGLA